MAIKCCKDCVPPKRYIGCHSICPDYIEEKAEYDRLKAIEQKNRSIHHSIISQRIDGVTRAQKRHGSHKTG
mgnify:CR=1 FL=1